MKIKPEHLQALRDAIIPIDTHERRQKYLDNQFSYADRCKDRELRFRWDLLKDAGIKIGDGKGMSGLPLYSYLNDVHINTALKSFIPPLET